MYYILLFTNSNLVIRLIYLLFVVLHSILCILVGYSCSTFTSTMQTSFQDIRRFSEFDLSLEQKLKILNFMKRFGKESSCISVRAYFHVAKKFPVKMANKFYSLFSGLLKLKTSSTS
ncbi:uncharacterized protein LOC111613672 [Centruroides sculpturatus]|uniref:uncharacterized protein LOC111613672 n=1 Tax=Centruroides sculpturatus TaxID=218467 RepID=UPI000C6E9ABD|nr:uncharacterized protein LOC111613672 [Centruroides sculpturatus]